MPKKLTFNASGSGSTGTREGRSSAASLDDHPRAVLSGNGVLITVSPGEGGAIAQKGDGEWGWIPFYAVP